MARKWLWMISTWMVAGCGPAVDGDSGDGDSATDSQGASTDTSETSGPPTTDPPPPGTSTTTSPETTDTVDPDTDDGGSSSGTGDPPPMECGEDGCKVDVVVVVDNSSRTGGAQRALALAMIDLDTQLRELGADAQVMFTTTDYGHPLCTPFKPAGYSPAQGAPISTACTQRLDDFTGLGPAGEDVSEVCTSVCPEALGPLADPFVAFHERDNNLPELVPAVDIDGDGRPESATARAMACLAPMGINGCGYESPLETLLQALNPEAAWNTADRPFLRPDAALGVVVVTDELDCSVADFNAFNDPAFMETSPANGQPAATSAMCWNAGVDCDGPDGSGNYDCSPAAGGPLHATDRYVDYLRETLVIDQKKPVTMLSIIGVPPVLAHNADPPFEAIEGGLFDLQIRDWQDEDVLPDEAAQGVTAEDKHFLWGIGPGCSQPQSTAHAQAVPPVRIPAVCESLNVDDRVRCCIESICDDDYGAGMQCLAWSLTNPRTVLVPDG